MKKIGLTCLMFTALAIFGVQARGSDTGEIWRCFDPYDFGRNKVLVELTRARNLMSIEELFEELKEGMKEGARAAGMEEALEELEGIEIKKLPDTLENRRTNERILERYNATRPGQISVAGVTHKAHFRIEGLNRRWDFGSDALEGRLGDLEDRLEDLGKGSDFEDLAKVLEDLIETNYAFIIKPDGSGLYYDFSRVGEGEGTGPSQRFDCVSP